MPDDERPSLEAPQLFGRRRTRRTEQAAVVDEPTVEEPVFEDAGLDITTALPEQDDDTGTDADADTGTGTTQAPTGTRRATRARGTRAPRAPRAPRPPRTGPLLPGRVAALVAGLAAGLALLGFTWLGFRTCEAVRGSTSCGTGPGMAALVVVLVLAAVVGGVLLSRFGAPDPGATAVLGVGLTAVLYLLTVDLLDNAAVLVVVPVVTALTFLLSWWLTTSLVDADLD